MAKVKIDLVRQERYEKMLLALQSLRDKGLWNSCVTIYSAHPRADHSVEVRLDKHDNLVLHLSEEYFEPITMHDHFLTKMEKKELKKTEDANKEIPGEAKMEIRRRR